MRLWSKRGLRNEPHGSLMYGRRVTGAVVAAGCFAFCLFVFGGSSPIPLSSPGPVASPHAAIEQDCAKCHVAADGNFIRLVRSTVQTNVAIENSRRCLACHTGIGESPFHSHSRPPAQWLVSSNQQPQLRRATAAVESELACSMCHQEHSGRDMSLTQISDRQCQNCHQKQFESFTRGHPELATYPYGRRTRIYFDHAKHLNQYFVDGEFQRLFPDGQAPTSCLNCHETNAPRDFMDVRSFETMCGSCHTSQVGDIEFPGVAFIALPVLRSEAVDQLSIGDWPRSNRLPKRHGLPPFMKMLLAGDAGYRNALRRFGDVKPHRLDEAVQREPQAVEDYLWAIKRLFYDVARDGERELAERLGDAYADLATMRPSIVESMVRMQQIHFPRLNDEFSSKTDETVAATSETANRRTMSKRPSAAEHTIGGGWYLRESDDTIRYRPTGHADPLLRQWLEHSIEMGDRARNDTSSQSRFLAEMLQVLQNPTASGTELTNGPVASGRCLQCHTVSAGARNATAKINWRARRPKDSVHTLTYFSHRPHVRESKSKNCQACHKLDTENVSSQSVLRPEFFQRDSHQRWQFNRQSDSVRTSGFLSMTKSNCSNCHNEQMVRQNCLTCHKYHTHISAGMRFEHTH